MKKRLIFAARWAVVIIATYLFSWTVSYLYIVGFDLQYFFRYLYYAWTGPGEMAVFTQIYALCLTGILLVLTIISRIAWRVFAKPFSQKHT